jgi:anaerobic selenocysteine-containing dehydrogenase
MNGDQMASKLNRRHFLKIATGAATATGIAASAQRALRIPYVRPPEETLPGEATWYASTCLQCPAGCGLLARVINGRPRKLEGNPDHPLNRGKLCARGQAGLNDLYNPDRFQNAVRQTGGRNSRKFDAIPWDEALSQVVSAIETTGNPNRVAFLTGDIPDHLSALIDLFLQSLGAQPSIHYDLHCELEGRAHLSALAQRWFNDSSLPVFDIARADVIFSFGANFLETWLSPVSQSVDYGQMRQGGFGGRGFVAQFEARLSSTAAAADEWLPIQMGTEGVIALALGRIIVEENLGSVGSHRPYAQLYSRLDVGELAQVAGLSVEKLRELAHIFAGADRPLAIPGGGLSGLSNGAQSMDAVMALNVLMRRIGREGGVFLPQSVPAQAYARQASFHTFEDLGNLIESMRTGQLDILFVKGTNPIFELPRWTGFREAMMNVPLVVSFNPSMDETSVWADLVLPDLTYLESWGFQLPSPGADRPVVNSIQPVVAPLYDTRSTADVILTLAASLGGEVAQALPWSDEVEFLEQASQELFDSSLGNFDARTPAGFWAKWRQFGGWWSEKPLRREPEITGLPADTIRIPEARFVGDTGEFPFHLLLYPSITLSDGRGANQPLLQEIPDPMTTARWGTWIEINPETAKQLDLEDNQIVRISSAHGELEAPVVIYPGIRPDTLAMPIGQGHEEFGRFASGRGVHALDLVSSFAATASPELLWGATRVRIEATRRKHEVARLESLEGEGRESIR